MRILHVYNSGLPDWRVEKSALTGSKNGHQVFFAGNMVSPSYKNSIFSNIYYINWTPKAMMGLPFYWHRIKKRFSMILIEVRPDIIHAHNIFSAKLASEFSIPLVYDDHEYWSKYAIIAKETKNDRLQSKSSSNPFKKYLIRSKIYFLNLHIIRTWTKWEREIISRYPTITVDQSIAEELHSKYNCKNVFVVPNYPIKEEIRDICNPRFHDKLSCVYAGVDKTGNYTKHRDMSELRAVFINNDIGTLTIIGSGEPEVSEKVITLGFLPTRRQMYEEMSRHSIGLIPWKKHWSHAFINLNKAYEYAHAGLVVFCISSLRTVIRDLGEHCVAFEDMNDLVTRLTSFSQNMDTLYKKRLQIFEYARKNLLWDNYERNIIESYKVC